MQPVIAPVMTHLARQIGLRRIQQSPLNLLADPSVVPILDTFKADRSQLWQSNP